jgi:uncharacterized protein (DUF427 family)
MNPAPGFKKRPDWRIVTKPASQRLQVTLGGAVIADSKNATVMQEGTYPPVYYFPRADVKMDRLERTAHKTHCPFKGDASYFSFKGGSENAVWSYETPYDEMQSIAGLVAFYPDKVEIKEL